MVKLRWLKNWKERKLGDISNVATGSAENFVSQGYAEYVQENNKSMPKSDTNPKNDTNSTGNVGVDTNLGKNDTNPSIIKKSKKQPSFIKKTSKTQEKGIYKAMIRDTNDTNDTNDTQKKPSRIKSIICIMYHEVVRRLGKSPKIKVFGLLLDGNERTYEEIAKETDQKYDYVRVLMNRLKDHFEEGSTIDGKKKFKLSPLGLQQITRRLENYDNAQKSAIKEEEQKDQKKKESETLQQKMIKTMDDMNPKINGKIITIDFKELLLYDSELADNLLDHPLEVIEHIKSHYDELDITDVRFINLPKTQKRTAENIRCEDIDTLLTVEGRCVSVSTVRPVITNAKFECPSCGTIISVLQIEKKFKEPSRCSCGRRGGFKTISRDMKDSSNIVIEDLQDNTENPNTQRINARIQNFLADNKNIGIFNLGDEVKVTGILRTVDSFDRGAVTINLGYLFEILDAEKKEEEILVEKFTEEQIEKIVEMAKVVNEEGMDDLVKSFAPDVFGYEYIKKALMLQACNKRNSPKKSSTRNKQNILLIGDPGIAKSVLCRYAMSVTPQSRKAAGGGSSAVGITASVVKEDESMGGYRIEAGALPLAKELFFLDEMNNLNDEDKPKLQEAMSEQMISINKANLHVNLKVTAGVLATANPKEGHFVEGIPYNKQFNIPSPILNRFDVIFVMKDIPNKERDSSIADIMIKRKRGEIKPAYSIEDLKKFFAYVRNHADPEITEDIAEKLKEIYANSRKNRNADVIINPRFMEALNRMIEASAKMRLSTIVEVKDIKRSLDILSQSHFKSNEYKNFLFEDMKNRKKPLNKSNPLQN